MVFTGYSSKKTAATTKYTCKNELTDFKRGENI